MPTPSGLAGNQRVEIGMAEAGATPVHEHSARMNVAPMHARGGKVVITWLNDVTSGTLAASKFKSLLK